MTAAGPVIVQALPLFDIKSTFAFFFERQVDLF